jgi:heavy metal sensor kinase
MKRLSIGIRLTLWYLAIFALAQVIFGAGMWLILRESLFDLVDDGLEAQVDDLTKFLQSQPKDRPFGELQHEIGQTYGVEHAGDYLQIYADSNLLIYRSEFLKSHSAALLSPDQVDRQIERSRKIAGHHFRFLFQKLEVNGRVYTVEMGMPADDAVETLHLFRSYLLMFAPLLLLVAAGGGFWLSRRALSPVDTLVQSAREIGGTSLNRRLQKLETGDELQRLSDTLNEMLDRIEAAFLRITQFTADASHELRTPVSLIRTEAELALRRSRGEAEYKESLRHILLEAERTTVLIEQMLALARTDSGREILQLQPTDLRQTLGGVVNNWQQVAVVRNLEFSSSLDSSDCLVMGDETLLRRLVDILLDNAFKYTPAPGWIHLTLQLKSESAVIIVQDSGVGISAEEHSKIFERFYRVDKARSRAQGGVGLGLAIAKWIVTRHRGSITVESQSEKGTTFRVELPTIAVPARNPQPA